MADYVIDEVVQAAISAVWELLRDCSDKQREDFLYELRDKFCFECGSATCDGMCANDE